MLRRFLIGALCFVLGFASCIASIVGAGWIAYSKVSLDSLEGAGLIEVDQNALRDPDAEVDITKLTLEGLVAEIGKLSKLKEPVSIDFLIERYRLKLPEETLKLLPKGVRGTSLAEIFSGGGIQKILEVTRVEDLYPLLPSDLLSEPAREALAGKTLKEVASLDLGSLLSDVKLGYLLGVKYVKNTETGKYEPIYQNPDQPTLPELLSEVNTAELIDLLAKGGDIAEIFGKYMNEALISHFMGAFMDLSDFPLSGILEGKTFGDVLVYDEAKGSYGMSLNALFDGTFAELFDLTPIYHDEQTKDFVIEWRDEKGAPVYGVLRGMASASLGSLLSGSFDMTALLSDVYLGDVMSYRPTFDEEGNITAWKDENGKEASGIMAPLVVLRLSEVTGDSFDVAKLLDGLYVGDLLSYTPIKDDPLDPDKITGWLSDGVPLKGADLATANIDLGRLLGDDTYKINSAFDSLLLGELLGYEKRDGTWYETEGSDKRVSALYASVADLSIGALISGESDFEAVLSDLYLGDLLGYEKVVAGEEITWYETRTDGSGSLILDGEGNPKLFPVSAIYARLADLTVGEMTAGGFDFATLFEGLCLGDVLDYTHDGDWYETKPDGTKGEKLSAVNAAIADMDLGELLGGKGFDITSVFSGIYLGEVLGYERGEKISGDGEDERYRWYQIQKNPDGTTTRLGEIDGIESRIASYKLGALIDGSVELRTEDLISGMTIGEIMGYTPCYKTDAYGDPTDEIDHWCDDGGNRVTGFFAAIASEEIMALSDGTLMSRISLGDAMGYYYDSTNAVWLVSAPTEGDPNPAKVSGITASFVNLKVGQMSDADAVSSVINGITLGDAMGYHYDSVNEVWLESAPTEEDPNPAKVSGVMGVLAGTEIGSLSSKLESAKVGDLLGYTPVKGDPLDPDKITGWKDGDEPVAPIINKICGATFDTLGDTLDTLALGDIFTAEELSSGFFKLLGENADTIKLQKIPEKATDAVKGATIGALMDAELLEIDSTTELKLNGICQFGGKDPSYWKTLTIKGFIDFITQ